MGAVPSILRPAFNLARVGLSLLPSHSAACVGSMPIATLTSLSVADTNRASLPSGITNPKSVESSQTAFASNGTPLAFTPGNGAVVPTGLGIDAGNACNAPDCSTTPPTPPHVRTINFPMWSRKLHSIRAGVIAKRSASSATSPGWNKKTNFGWGVGGSVLLPPGALCGSGAGWLWQSGLLKRRLF